MFGFFGPSFLLDWSTKHLLFGIQVGFSIRFFDFRIQFYPKSCPIVFPLFLFWGQKVKHAFGGGQPVCLSLPQIPLMRCKIGRQKIYKTFYHWQQLQLLRSHRAHMFTPRHPLFLVCQGMNLPNTCAIFLCSCVIPYAPKSCPQKSRGCAITSDSYPPPGLLYCHPGHHYVLAQETSSVFVGILGFATLAAALVGLLRQKPHTPTVWCWSLFCCICFDFDTSILFWAKLFLFCHWWLT